VLLGSAGKSFALPECEGSPFTGVRADKEFWDNCEGTIIYPNEDKYVGEFRDDKKHGQGTYYYLADNQLITSSGLILLRPWD
jgi:hypothetical protein